MDGSAKFLFRLPGGGSVESVLMPAPKRITMCISSQVGCTLDCIFCQTGRMGFHRNLDASEIVGQVVPLWKRVRALRTRTNIVAERNDRAPTTDAPRLSSPACIR